MLPATAFALAFVFLGADMFTCGVALALTGVVLLAGSMALSTIVGAQSIPFLVVQPLGFFVFMAAASAEMSRAPFDMIEAESELGAGYHTEYTGMKFAMFQLAEFMAPLVTAVVTTVLFLGGAQEFGPIPGQLMFLLKAFLVVFFLLFAVVLILPSLLQVLAEVPTGPQQEEAAYQVARAVAGPRLYGAFALSVALVVIGSYYKILPGMKE